jgi:hypothetical protein
MNINRNNYEEFFLLYIDNELCVQEKNAVDVFLKENPDLQEEMLMLQQSVLIPDEAVFADKQSLLKQLAISDEMQQQLILMLDNELDKKASGKLLGLVEKDAVLKQEWQILQQTKLPAAEKIIFEDKAILYKEEGGRVISFKWWRIAAAALLIGFGVWGAFNYSNKPANIQTPETVTNKPAKAAAPVIVTDDKKEQPVTQDKNSTVDNAAAINQTQQDEKIKSSSSFKTKIVTDDANKQKKAALKQVNDVAKQPAIKAVPDNNLPKPSLENFNSIPRNNNDVAIVPPAEDKSKTDEVINAEEPATKNDFASQIKYIDSDTENQDEPKGVKSKIGGFFKKLKRVVERKTNTKSGDNSFKIANMSFAVQ